MTKFEKPAAFSRRALLKTGGALVVSIGMPISLDAVLAVSVHRDKGRQLIGRQLRLCCRRRGALSAGGAKRKRRTDRDDERATGLQQCAAREVCGFFHSGHCGLPQPIIAAARLTARTIAMWVPQRHFRPRSAVRISASVGFLLSRRNAAAVMIQPLMQ